MAKRLVGGIYTNNCNLPCSIWSRYGCCLRCVIIIKRNPLMNQLTIEQNLFRAPNIAERTATVTLPSSGVIGQYSRSTELVDTLRASISAWPSPSSSSLSLSPPSSSFSGGNLDNTFEVTPRKIRRRRVWQKEWKVPIFKWERRRNQGEFSTPVTRSFRFTQQHSNFI